ncbi:hypothetical protein HZZ00_37545 (plasmid) [Streptomyces sp. NEAU-sy36]|uniref:hypothetical protein n=1 Tax=unclassified Streptomyces TaxID=2593676 RepID=UPI0015D6183A|nr:MULTISPECIES: hypothetical protein [unclassified Streptomyces]QLJ06741.1 hypothetical protein HZZ00_37545 [Streptomyces sp. NEAU-sy36]
MTTTAPPPPQNAVDRDPHWMATRARLAARQRPIATMTICDDQSVKDALATAQYAARRAKSAADDNPGDKDLKKLAAAAEKELEAAQKAFDEAAIVLRFQALRRPDFEALKKAHPATEEQAEDGMAFNPETLCPELIAAASLDGITAEEATEYLTEWSEGEAAQLFDTAWQVQGETRADLGKG